MRWYVLNLTITSSGAEQRAFTPYDNHDTAIRKFYECFNTVGGGPKKIIAILFDENLVQIKRDYWMKEEEEGEES